VWCGAERSAPTTACTGAGDPLDELSGEQAQVIHTHHKRLMTWL
jgi:hypothetical protein